jgi:hypothetical protein
VNFTKSLVGIGARTITTKNAIKGTLVDNNIEKAIFELELTYIALLVNKRGVFLLVQLLHSLDNSEANIDVHDILEAIIEHFLGKSYSANL